MCDNAFHRLPNCGWGWGLEGGLSPLFLQKTITILPPPFKDGQLKWCTWSAHAYRCSGYNCCTCKETYLSLFFKDGIMFYIVGIFIRMSFVHAFIILWTQSNMNTGSAGHCMQPIVNPNCEHFGAYHWLFLCYSIFFCPLVRNKISAFPSELLYYLHLF